MPRLDCKPLSRELKSIFGDGWVRRHAEETGAWRRQRKVDIVAFFWSVVLGFAVGRVRTLAELRRAYERDAAMCIEESSFYARFNAGFAALLKRAVSSALGGLADTGGKLKGRLAAFQDLLMFDATVVRLHELLQGAYAACRTNHTKAAAKLHVVMSLLSATPTKVKLTSERTNDRSPWRRIGKWVEGRLLLFDLGYLSYQLFDRIERNGGYFISRLKTTSNPLIGGGNRRWRGQARDLVGLKLQDALAGLKRDIVDVTVEVRFRRRSYRGKASMGTARFRVVAVRNDQTGRYHVYMTNVAAQVLDGGQIAETYRLRWQIELLFKQLRTHYRLDQLPSRKRVVVEALLYAAILALIVARHLLSALRRHLPDDRHIPDLRWAAVFAGIAADLLRELIPRRRRTTPSSVWALLADQARDPNPGRPAAPAQHLDYAADNGSNGRCVI